jgi:hypothetical protein
MNKDLFTFAARLRGLIEQHQFLAGGQPLHYSFDSLALKLFSLQYEHNLAYRRICDARHLTPETVEHWAQIPFVPTGAFKELELSCILPDERTAAFHSSGTTEQKPGRHFHNAESLALYEVSLMKWFQFHFNLSGKFMFLTPEQNAAPRSSLVHMFETVRKHAAGAEFCGHVAVDGSWIIDFDATVQKLKAACAGDAPLTILGTAFSFVHLLDFLAENRLRFELPVGSRVMETGGYKNRSRVLPKHELHGFIEQGLGIPKGKILCEYGMSELSSQAYNSVSWAETGKPGVFRKYQFPPWARVQIVSPETGIEVVDGETGIIRIFDLANVFSVAAIQTEDLGIHLGDHFDLAGRAQLAEPRGCSLMSA